MKEEKVRMYSEDVDEWIADNGEYDSSSLLMDKMPGQLDKLDRLDKRIIKILNEIRKIFPDAQYYTAGGGFNLLLGDSHGGDHEEPQRQRVAWSGKSCIGDGDW